MLCTYKINEKLSNNIRWNELMLNPHDGAIDLLLENKDKVINKYIFHNTNPRIIQLLDDTTQLDFNSINLSPIIIEYICKNYYRISNKLWTKLCTYDNDMVIDLLFSNIDKINFYSFSANKNDRVVDYLLQNLDKINWITFSWNENDKAIDYLIKHKKRINWTSFSFNENDNAVKYCIKRYKKIDWSSFSSNKNDIAVEYAIQNPDKIVWTIFSANKNNKAVKYLTEYYPDKIDYYTFCDNPNDLAVIYLIKNQNKIKWFFFQYNKNPKVLPILLENIDKINVDKIISQHNIFEYVYNYDLIRQRMNIYAEELIAKVWAPERFSRWPENLFDD
jgi:hypothetical protein